MMKRKTATKNNNNNKKNRVTEQKLTCNKAWCLFVLLPEGVTTVNPLPPSNHILCILFPYTKELHVLLLHP